MRPLSLPIYIKVAKAALVIKEYMDINLILTRNQTKSKKQAGYKFMPTVQTFDYLPIGSKEDYPISFRIARFKIADDSYETVITNLDRFCFSAENLRNYIT